MGATLHTHIEVQYEGTWLHFAAPSVKRNYDLIALITGDRAKPGIQKLGMNVNELPEDASEVTKVCYDMDRGYGLHHLTVLPAEKLPVLQDMLYHLHPEIKRTGVDELDLEDSIFRTYIAGGTLCVHEGFEDLRIICWVDN